MYIKVKSILDKIFAALLLIILFIPMIIIGVLIKIEDGGPIFYKSKRVGKNLDIINVYKFRSMRCDRKELNSNFSHNEMVTKVGKIIRKTSLDEIPQLFNILMGNMSFIGPRPWIPEYYKYFTEEQKMRVSVVPGISGLAQVNGRNGIDIEKKIQYDLEYIDNISFGLDFKIMIQTIVQVFKKSNAEISEAGIKNEIRELKKNRNENSIKQRMIEEAVDLEKQAI